MLSILPIFWFALQAPPVFLPCPAGTMEALEAIKELPGTVTVPEVKFYKNPSFTDTALRHQTQAVTVNISLIVDTEGKPCDLRLISQAPLGLDEAALRAVSMWRFTPASKGGKTIPHPAKVETRFERIRDEQVFWEQRREELNLAIQALPQSTGNARTAHLGSIERLAKSGYAPAQGQYAILLAEGTFLPKDLEASNDYFLKARAQNDPAAYFHYGRFQLDGKVFLKDEAAALKDIRRSAALKFGRAYTWLGDHYTIGDYLPKDDAKALASYLAGAALHEVRCMLEAARRLQTTKPAEAIAWASLAADKGNPQARILLNDLQATADAITLAQAAKLKARFQQQP